uniref:Uncharacterized protein n=1 Tax=Anguilla anguilla TaxID=7936 RepID=A0A0E9TFL3_ANGAN
MAPGAPGTRTKVAQKCSSGEVT